MRTSGLIIILVFLLFACQQASNQASTRERLSFNADWLFIKYDAKDPVELNSIEHSWRKLDLPHDWAIEGPFTEDAYYQMGYLPYEGVGWYRKSFELNEPGKKVLLEFDGAMMLPKVWVNGEYVGEWGFGYTSFALDISDFINHDKPNIIEVRVENLDYSSRWYPGSGIYRNTWLTVTDPIHITHWGTFITTPEVDDNQAKIRLQTELINESDQDANLSIQSEIIDPAGNVVGKVESKEDLASEQLKEIVQEVVLQNPKRWDVNDPNMYSAITKVLRNGKEIDQFTTPFGIRTFKFDADKGFILNGRQLKIQGVNMHHDLGPLGAAVNYRATERQLQIMKNMGVNAIRTAHNPPSPEQLELCDKMGILVMDESFDEWRRRKLNVKNSYSILFDDWAIKDMEALVKRDRNHPSVILWSTGNEVPELGTGKLRVTLGETGEVMEGYYIQKGESIRFNAWEETWYGRYDGQKLVMGLDEQAFKALAKKDDAPSLSGTQWDMKSFKGDNLIYSYDFLDDNDGKNSSKMLTQLCHDLDPTRPVSSGIHLSIKLDQELMNTFDVAGFNYWHEQIEDLHKQYPDKPLLVTEAAATLSTRGEYFFPVERIYCGFSHESKQISSYDLTNTCFGTLPDVEFKLQDENPWLAGQFVWAGFDYHGEPDPYEDAWPAHSSYFGIVDMCGFEKDRYFLYQSQWTESPMVHLLPHWTWPGREGEKTPVFVYSNCDQVELIVNGESMGKRKKEEGLYRYRWEDVVYQPGSIKAIGYDSDGNNIAEKEIFTAGTPRNIELIADRTTIVADGEDLSFVTVNITDEAGNICPDANHMIDFEIQGNGMLAGVGNGDPTSIESYQEPRRSAFHGKALLILESTQNVGEIIVKATSPDLLEGSITIQTVVD